MNFENTIFVHLWFVISIFIASLIIPLLHVLVIDRKYQYHGQIMYTLLRYSLFFNIGCFFLLRAVEHIMHEPTLVTALHLGGTPYYHMIWLTELALAGCGFFAGLFNHHFWLATICVATAWNGGSAMYHLATTPLEGAAGIITAMRIINVALSLWTPLLYAVWLCTQPKKHKDSDRIPND